MTPTRTQQEYDKLARLNGWRLAERIKLGQECQHYFEKLARFAAWRAQNRSN